MAAAATLLCLKGHNGKSEQRFKTTSKAGKLGGVACVRFHVVVDGAQQNGWILCNWIACIRDVIASGNSTSKCSQSMLLH